jgi:hypothetical protein
MTSYAAGELAHYPTDGQQFYVPASGELPDTATLYRLYNGRDHMVSPVPGESGYDTEGPIGHPWTSSSARPGLTMLTRTFHPVTGDHGLRTAAQEMPGYSDEELGLYGFGRFGKAEVEHTSLSCGGVTVRSNNVAGGAVWAWSWDGVQFVNDADFGRQIQSAIFLPDDGNPTEAGAANTARVSLGRYGMFGSPVARSEVSPDACTMQTRALPLEWSPGGNLGLAPNQPALWDGYVIGKDLTLNYRGLGAVAKYDAYFYLPQDVPAPTQLETTGYLRANFSHAYACNAQTGQYQPQSFDELGHIQLPNDGFPFTYGGPILADPATGHAMGVYGQMAQVFGTEEPTGGTIRYMTIWNFDDGASDDQLANATYKWAAFQGPGAFAAGEHTTTLYIINGTLAEVCSRMMELYHAGDR